MKGDTYNLPSDSNTNFQIKIRPKGDAAPTKRIIIVSPKPLITNVKQRHAGANEQDVDINQQQNECLYNNEGMHENQSEPSHEGMKNTLLQAVSSKTCDDLAEVYQNNDDQNTYAEELEEWTVDFQSNEDINSNTGQLSELLYRQSSAMDNYEEIIEQQVNYVNFELTSEVPVINNTPLNVASSCTPQDVPLDSKESIESISVYNNNYDNYSNYISDSHSNAVIEKIIKTSGLSDIDQIEPIKIKKSYTDTFKKLDNLQLHEAEITDVASVKKVGQNNKCTNANRLSSQNVTPVKENREPRFNPSCGSSSSQEALIQEFYAIEDNENKLKKLKALEVSNKEEKIYSYDKNDTQFEKKTKKKFSLTETFKSLLKGKEERDMWSETIYDVQQSSISSSQIQNNPATSPKVKTNMWKNLLTPNDNLNIKDASHSKDQYRGRLNTAANTRPQKFKIESGEDRNMIKGQKERIRSKISNPISNGQPLSKSPTLSRNTGFGCAQSGLSESQNFYSNQNYYRTSCEAPNNKTQKDAREDIYLNAKPAQNTSSQGHAPIDKRYLKK